MQTCADHYYVENAHSGKHRVINSRVSASLIVRMTNLDLLEHIQWLLLQRS